MRVLLCTPREYHTPHGSAMNAPITTAYLARRLDDAGMEVMAVDIGMMRNREAAIAPILPEADALGLSVMHSTMEGARRLITYARHIKSDIWICCGGVAPTVEPETFLAMGADCVVTGQADGNVATIFKQQPSGIIEGLPGDISGRPLWEVHCPKPWEYPGSYKAPAHPEAIVMATRGCPWHCTMCGNVVWGGQRTRYRDVDDVRDEQGWLAQQGVKGIFWYDDELIEHRNLAYAANVLRGDLAHVAQGRCDIRQGDVGALRELVAAGLKRVMWGVESADVGVLQALQKGTTPEAIEETLRTAHDAGIENHAYLMVGMPEEGPEEAERTYQALKGWLAEGIVRRFQATAMTPMPGTPIYAQAQAEGWLSGGDPFQFRATGGTPWMSQAEIIAHHNRLIHLGREYDAFI